MSEIAAELNKRGIRRDIEKPWDVAAVQRVRYAEGWHRKSTRSRRAIAQRADGLYSIHGVAQRLEVAPRVVRWWASSGKIKPVEGGGTGHVMWFNLDD